MSEENKTPLLEVKDLKKWFPAKSSPFSKEKVFIKAVDGVSFTLNAGETLGVVGESGCGKSTMGRSVLRLLEPTNGQVLFEGKDYTALKSSELAKSRSDLQIIFQDRMGATKWEQRGKKYEYSDHGDMPEERMLELQERYLNNDIACYIGEDTPF